MRFYICGPVSNVDPHKVEHNKLQFKRAKAKLSYLFPQHEFVNPLEVNACLDKSECGGHEVYGHTWECWLRYDLKVLLDCNGLVKLFDWQYSRGAILEHRVASDLGYAIYHYSETTGLMGYKET